jgi:hypothetical protein
MMTPRHRNVDEDALAAKAARADIAPRQDTGE